MGVVSQNSCNHFFIPLPLKYLENAIVVHRRQCVFISFDKNLINIRKHATILFFSRVFDLITNYIFVCT